MIHVIFDGMLFPLWFPINITDLDPDDIIADDGPLC